MSRLPRSPLVLLASLGALLIMPASAEADHGTRPQTENIHAKGHSPHVSSFLGLADGARHINSDLAFWGRTAFHGNYDGFRIIDISDPDNPSELHHQRCNGDQGDLVVWDNILVRAWNSKKNTPRLCDGEVVPAQWEGVHVFDIGNLSDPDLVASVELPCGSHTLTVGGVSAGNLIVYSNNSSSAGCGTTTDQATQDELGDFMDVIAVPLGNLQGASLLRREPLAGPATAIRTGCHDAGVILGDENKLACASADLINVFDIGENETPGGTLEDPALLFTISEPGVGQAGTNGRWHSTTFTWDGEVIAAGWEPGGGAEPECEATDPVVDKSMFLYDADTGTKLGQWVLPASQSADENCTIHNYNTVPLRSGRDVVVGGHYQAGTWVVDISDPANPATVAWSDPPPLGTVTNPAGAVVNEIGGAWSTYYYNNFVYESEITKGLNVFRVSDSVMAGPVRLAHLNPQTQDFTIG
ncbi:MAG: LVIVD repeat-containing protein [Stackebrandtia sp.]